MRTEVSIENQAVSIKYRVEIGRRGIPVFEMMQEKGNQDRVGEFGQLSYVHFT